MRRSLPRTSSNLPSPRLLAAARSLVGLSQGELAVAAGLAKSSIGRYEAGLTALRSDTLGAILAVLRARGVRFVEETDEVAMGLLLMKTRSSKTIADPGVAKEGDA